MNYTDFADYIKNCFREIMGKDARINIITIIGNNDCERDALVILEGNQTMSPSIYLRDYYEEYKAGTPIGDIVSHIYTVYRRYKLQNDINAELFYDFEKIKKSIVYKLVNKEKNKKMLQSVPHFDFLDLSVVFYFLVNTGRIQNATAMIRNEHLKMWNVSGDEIYNIATENTPKLLCYNIKPIDEVLWNYIEQCNETEGYFADGLSVQKEMFSQENNDMQMYVLTNSFKMNGAACMLYKEPLKLFSAKVDNDIYIIPSSVHEVIMLPADDICKNELNTMVQQVNKEEVAESDILSDHIYMYDREKEAIVIP